MHKQSVVDFNTNSRIHFGLDVKDLDAALSFYRILFGTEPAKVRSNYAKFETEDPPVNLALNQHDNLVPPQGRSLHYGIQVKSTEAVEAVQHRFEAAGLSVLVEEETACCYAVQDKVWVTDPDGHRWEVFVVLGADVDQYAPEEAQGACCSDESQGDTCCTPAEAAGCCV